MVNCLSALFYTLGGIIMKDNIQNERRQHNEDNFISQEEEKQFNNDFVDLLRECCWVIGAIIIIGIVCFLFD